MTLGQSNREGRQISSRVAGDGSPGLQEHACTLCAPNAGGSTPLRHHAEPHSGSYASFDALAQSAASLGRYRGFVRTTRTCATVVVTSLPFHVPAGDIARVRAATFLILADAPHTIALDCCLTLICGFGLIARERPTATLLACRRSNNVMGLLCGARPHAVGTHVQRVLPKVGVRSCREAATAVPLDRASELVSTCNDERSVFTRALCTTPSPTTCVAGIRNIDPWVPDIGAQSLPTASEGALSLHRSLRLGCSNARSTYT
jgi:hypothetical protein